MDSGSISGGSSPPLAVLGFSYSFKIVSLLGTKLHAGGFEGRERRRLGGKGWKPSASAPPGASGRKGLDAEGEIPPLAVKLANGK